MITIRLKDLRDPTSDDGKLMIQLMKQLLASVPFNPVAENAIVVRIVPLMDSIFDHIRQQQDSTPYLELLRDVFKALQGCKNEVLHRDFQLASTLSMLRSMLDGPLQEGQQELLVELILTLPTRLSNLLHFLPQLMRPLLEAMRGKDHLVTLGMKTLEYWVDSLNPEFLEPAMAEVLPDLMAALHVQLSPLSHPSGSKALNLLGKLGGRNRRYLKEPIHLDYKDNPEHGLRLILTFEPNTSFLVPLDRCIMLAQKTISRIQEAPAGPEAQQGRPVVSAGNGGTRASFAPEITEHRHYYRRQALSFLQVCLASVLNLRSPEDSALPGTGVDKLREMLVGEQLPPHIEVTPQKVDFGVKTKTQLQAEKHVLKSLLTTIIGLSHDRELSDQARPFATGVCTHFSMLFAAGAASPPPAPPSSRFAETDGQDSANSGTSTCPASLKELDPHLFLDALVEVLTDPAAGCQEAALDALEQFVDCLLILHHAQAEKRARTAGQITSHVGQVNLLPEEAAEGLDDKDERQEEELGRESTQPNRPLPFRSHDFARRMGYPLVLDQLLSRLLHCCYDDSWPSRMGGVAALQMLLDHLPLDYLCAWLPASARALFMVMRWLPEHCSRDAADIQELLERIAARCFLTPAPADVSSSPKPVHFPQEDEFQSALKGHLNPLVLPLPKEAGAPRTPGQVLAQGMLDVLNGEIFGQHSSRCVRSCVGKCLEVICNATGRTSAELLRPIMPAIDKKRLLPLRHVEVQIGTALALTFCLRQKPQCLVAAASPDLVQVFKDATAIADHDDNNLAAILAHVKGDINATVTRLRTVSVQLLCAAVSWPSFRDDPNQKAVKEPIIRCFFKSLTSPVPGIVAAAKEGLRNVTASQPRLLPKELLQTSLRPLLMNLAIHTSLNLPLLKGLAQLLELLAMWFNPNLGDKLLDHLRQWLKPSEILNSSHSWKAGEEVLVAAATLELFHLLPQLPRPDQFLESAHQDRPGLVVLTIELENLLHKYPSCPAPSKLASPYREPLTRFLNRYPQDAIRYFLEVARMQNPHYFFRFLTILKSGLGEPLRAAVADSPEAQAKLVQLLRGELTRTEPDKEEAEYHAVHLVSVLAKLHPQWLASQKTIMDAVLERWRSPARKQRVQVHEETMSRAAIMETARLARCLMSYIAARHSDMTVLFELLDVYKMRSRLDFEFVGEFLATEVAQRFTAAEKQVVMKHLLATVKARNQQTASVVATDELLVLGIRHVAIPVMSAAFEKREGAAILDIDTVTSIVKDLLDPPEETPIGYGDTLRIELLQLATLLVKHVPDRLVSHRKELIKFGWNHLKREESACKYYAFINVCQFLEAYQAPEKIILQVFVALLRNCQPDTRRAQVCQALDILVPALPRRMQQGDHKFPIWIRYTKKILVEEGHSVPHLVHIWQLLVRHADLFYQSRAQFVPQMVNSLSRLGLPLNSQAESRRLSIDLATLIIRWERQRQAALAVKPLKAEEQQQRKRQREELAAPPVGASQPALPQAPEQVQGTEVEPSVAAPEPGEAALSASDDLVKTEDLKEEPDTGEPPAKQLKIEELKTEPAMSTAKSQDLTKSLESFASVAGASLPIPEASALSNPEACGFARTASITAIAAGPSGDEEFKPSSAMEDMVVTFLIRMSFVLCESKDRELQALVAHTLLLVREAFEMWPHVSLKLAYLEKLLNTNLASGQDPPAVVVNALQVMDLILSYNPSGFLTSAAAQLVLLVEPVFKTSHQRIVELLGGIIRKLYKAFPAGGAEPMPPPAAAAVAAVQKHVEASLSEAGEAASRPGSTTNHAGLGAALSLMSVMTDCCPDFVLRMATPLVRVLYFHARQQNHLIQQQGGLAAAGAAVPGTPQLLQGVADAAGKADAAKPAAAKAGAGKGAADAEVLLDRLGKDESAGEEQTPWVPDYGTLAWNMVHGLRLAAHHTGVLINTENKKAFMQTLAMFMGGGKATPQAILMEMLSILQRWLLHPDDKVGYLTIKESILFLQRMAQLERGGATGGELKRIWESTYLDLVHTLCTNEIGPEGELLRREAFSKVERVFLLGLRACDPKQRAQFLALYNQLIDSSRSSNADPTKAEESKLFKRLQFIISIQDWEALSNRFWLNQCLDMLLSILVEDEAITLAPNSAQIAPLLSATKQNIFNPASRSQAQRKQAAANASSSVDAGVAAVKEEQAGDLGSGAAGDATSLPGSDAGQPEYPEASTPAEPMEGVTAPDQPPSSVDELASYGVELPPHVLNMLQKHSEFLEDTGQLRVSNLVRALREVAHADSGVAYHCWVLIFPIVWATLQKENQVLLAKPMIGLLSKEYHGRQAALRPNVVQALLEGISLSQPQPKIPSELIKFLGKTYNAWHIAIPLLESHVMLFPQESRCFDALAELYKQLGEHDVLAGLWKKRCAVAETRIGLSCMQHGRWEDGQKVFHGVIAKPASARVGPAANRSEQSMWVEQWTNCARQLNQWDTIIEFARDTDQNETLMDCLWKVPDWTALRGSLLPKGNVDDNPNILMIRTRLALQDGNVQEAQELIHKCMFRTLHRWWQLPETGIWPALQLLESLQPLVELQESARVLLELAVLQQQRPDYMYSDLKDIMETWRLRLPNEWESLAHWGDVLIWRNHIYNIIINALNDFQELLPQLHQLGYRDKAWSVNQLGAAARKQGQYSLSISSINKLYGYNRMDVQEAFVKIREQAKAYLAGKEEVVTGLNLITTTNLEYFTAEHQAEIFRLKGMFHQDLGEQQAASNAFCTALTLHRQLPAGWLSWGKWNDSMYASSGDKTQLESAAACYLQSIRFGSEAGQAMVPRVLHLLSFENSGGEISRVLEKQQDLPMWVLLVWIPQLLMSLQRPEVAQVKRLLVQMAVSYPQALYYNLRTFLLSLRESAVKQLQDYSSAAKQQKAAAEKLQEAERQKAVAVASGDQAAISATEAEHVAAAKALQAAQSVAPDKPPEMLAFEAGREVMEALRAKHGALVHVLESLLTEIGSRFVPKPAERLLSVVHMLLHRCYKAPCANMAEVPQSLRKELSGVCKACFSADQVAKHGWEMKQHREAFLKDLDPGSEGFPATLGSLVECLKGWRSTLQTAVEDYMPAILKLEQESRPLQDLSPLDVEMPGQYLSGEFTGSPDQVVKLERIGSDVHIVRRHGSSYRRLKLYGSDGHARYFLVQTPGTGHWSATGTSDERIMQLLRMFNRLLHRHPESRKRQLAFHTPAIVTIWPQVRLVEEEPSYCSCGEAYEVNCARYGREPDLPITHFKDKCCSETGQILPDPEGKQRLQAYKDIESGVVSENVLSQYMYKTLPSCNHLWTFKKQFCSQLGLSAFLCHALQLGGRSPNKILFTKSSGAVFQMDLYPIYDSRNFLLECNEPVPFRLTRNLVTFFTPFGVEGVFAIAMSATAAATVQPSSNLVHLLSQFFRDDIMMTQQRRSVKASGQGTPAPAAQDLKDLVKANIEHCVKRIHAVAPSRDKIVLGQAVADIQAGTSKLLEAAMNPHSLCRMEPTWHPWF